MRTIGEKVSPPTLFLGISRSGACGGARGARLAGRLSVPVLGSNVCASGSPVPRRRTLVAAIHGLHSLGPACASPSGLRLSATPALGARATPCWRRWGWMLGADAGGGCWGRMLGAVGRRRRRWGWVAGGKWAEGSCRASRSGFDFLGHAEDFVEARDPAEDLLDAVVEHHPHPVGTGGAADVLRGGSLEGELADLAAHHHQFEDP